MAPIISRSPVAAQRPVDREITPKRPEHRGATAVFLSPKGPERRTRSSQAKPSPKPKAKAMPEPRANMANSMVQPLPPPSRPSFRHDSIGHLELLFDPADGLLPTQDPITHSSLGVSAPPNGPRPTYELPRLDASGPQATSLESDIIT
ncbi:MAG: hypothetical protein M1823_001535 [Watsoniomyces obsoletus]|nr:MAG: hypothetical protein M1823_001535 [Watsoniomyces obsoletus]